MIDNMDKQTICLNMIVKDEECVILNTLDNLCKNVQFDYWVICDTGSSDNTKQLIIDYFSHKNIPGELIEHTWKNFGYNRNLALKAAFHKSDYLFIFDADDSIQGNLLIPSRLLFDEYTFKIGKVSTYYRPLLINNHIEWKWVGVLHEYLTSIASNTTTTIEGDYYIDSCRNGSRSKDPDKYLKDAILLENKFIEEKDRNLANRYAFYCAQSYMDYGNINKSIEWYKKVLTLNNWNQEKFIACYNLGNLYKSNNDILNSIKYYLKTIEYDNERIEGIICAVEHYYTTEQHLLVNMFYKNYKNYNKQLKNKLFLDTDKYNDKLEFFNSISAFYVNEKLSGYQCCKNIIINGLQGHSEIDKTFSNLQFYISEIKSDLDTFDLFQKYNEINIKSLDSSNQVWNILFEQNCSKLLCSNKH